MDCACVCHIPGHSVEVLDDDGSPCCACLGLRALTAWPPIGVVAGAEEAADAPVDVVRPIIGEKVARFRGHAR